MKKQTAVEWLIEQMRLRKEQGLTLSFYDLEMFSEQAKAMEKQQMKNMYVEGSFAKMRHFDGLEYIEAEQYYNETFKSE